MYIQKRGNYWVVCERGSNRVISRHRSRHQADQAYQKASTQQRRKERRRG